MLAQRTLKAITRAVGVGIHTGQRVELTLKPAPPDTGIVFRRVDLAQPVEIPARWDCVSDTRMASTISAGGDAGAPRVQTIEHFMSACCGLGLDNLVVDITADEMPVLDGSSASFVYLLQSAGLAEQPAARRFLKVLRPIEVRQGEGERLMWSRLEPHAGFALQFEIDFRHPAVDATGQRVSFELGSGLYARDIARARTFGFTKDVEAMRARGLTLGGAMDNAIVIGDDRVLNAGGLRYDDEFAKHKILDAMGDLYVAGHPMLARFTSYKGGHALNNRLLRALMQDRSAWELVQFDSSAQAPAGFAELGQPRL